MSQEEIGFAVIGMMVMYLLTGCFLFGVFRFSKIDDNDSRTGWFLACAVFWPLVCTVMAGTRIRDEYENSKKPGTVDDIEFDLRDGKFHPHVGREEIKTEPSERRARTN